VAYTAKVAAFIKRVRDLIGDNENRQKSFTLRSTGIGIETATVTIGTSISTDLTKTGSTPTEVSLVLSAYSTIYDLIDAINAVAGHEAIFVGKDGSHNPADLVPSTGSILEEEFLVYTRHWFSDAQIYTWLESGCYRFFPNIYIPENLPEEYSDQVVYAAAANGITALIADAAKYFSASIEGFSANIEQRVSQYRELYRQVEDMLRTFVGGKVFIGRLLHNSKYTGRKAPSDAVYQIGSVVLAEIDEYDDTSCELSWTTSLERDFYGYEVYYREVVAYVTDDDYELLTTIYDRHNTDYEVTDLTAGTAYDFKIRNVVSLDINRGNEWPAVPASNNRLYADSNERQVTLET